jgi:5-methylcytosine-specific restriction endonuclease McrA
MIKFKPDLKPPKREKKPKQAIRRTTPPKSVSPITKGEKVRHKAQDAVFYAIIWQSSIHRCTNCGKSLGWEPKKYFFHHLVQKAFQHKYSVDIRYRRKNIVLLCWECHNQVSINPFAKTVAKIRELTEQMETELEQYKTG